MLYKLSHLVIGVATVACTFSVLGTPAEGQTFRQEGRIQARASRQQGRIESRNFGNGYNTYYAPGGYYRYGYAGYGPVYLGPGNYGGAGYGSPGYYGGSSVYGRPAYGDGYAAGPAYRGNMMGANRPAPRAYLGITMSETPDGVVRVSSVRPDSPAAEAGVRPGDVLLSLDGREIYAAQDVSQMVARHNPGDSVELNIDRNGRNDRLEAVLTDQTAQFGGAPQQNYGPGYGQPTNSGPRPMAPMQARRPGNQAFDPNLYDGYPLY